MQCTCGIGMLSCSSSVCFFSHTRFFTPSCEVLDRFGTVTVAKSLGNTGSAPCPHRTPCPRPRPSKVTRLPRRSRGTERRSRGTEPQSRHLVESLPSPIPSGRSIGTDRARTGGIDGTRMAGDGRYTAPEDGRSADGGSAQWRDAICATNASPSVHSSPVANWNRSLKSAHTCICSQFFFPFGYGCQVVLQI